MGCSINKDKESFENLQFCHDLARKNNHVHAYKESIKEDLFSNKEVNRAKSPTKGSVTRIILKSCMILQVVLLQLEIKTIILV